MIFRLSKEFEIYCGHYLPGHPDCGTQHGHNYRIKLHFSTDKLQGGMVIDFGKAKKEIKEKYHHKNLNELDDASLPIPTAEFLALEIFNHFDNKSGAASIDKVEIWETPKSYVSIEI